MSSGKARVSFKDSQASALLDLIRALAAILVLLEHWRNLAFVDFEQIPHRWKLLAAPFYLLCSPGHQAVVIFFVLSGYLISGSVFRSWRLGTWSWSSYFTHRLIRLWIVLLPALVLCGVWDAMGAKVAPGFYAGSVMNHVTFDTRHAHTPAIFFGNVAFLQTIFVPVFGSNGPLWSLACEFWYYVFFPLGLVAIHPTSRLWQRLLCMGLLIGLLVSPIGHVVGSGFPIWLMGTVLAIVPAPRVGSGWRWLAAIAYCPLVFLFARPGSVPLLARMTEHGGDFILGIFTAIFLWIMLSAREAVGEARWAKTSVLFSSFSYTLYAAHFPWLQFGAALLFRGDRSLPAGTPLVIAVLLLVSALGYAFVVAWLTEFRTATVRGHIEQRLGLRAPASLQRS